MLQVELSFALRLELNLESPNMHPSARTGRNSQTKESTLEEEEVRNLIVECICDLLQANRRFREWPSSRITANIENTRDKGFLFNI